jgi:hypothetical protein
MRIQNWINNIVRRSATSFYRQTVSPTLDQVINSLRLKSTKRSLDDGLPVPQERSVETPKNSVQPRTEK